MVLALGGWGIRAPQPPGQPTLSATSVLLFLRGGAQVDPAAPPAEYRFELGETRVDRPHRRAARCRSNPASRRRPTRSLRTDPLTLNDVLADPRSLDAAVADGRAEVGGDIRALRRLLGSVSS